jgi:hypothetical protein
MGIDNSIKELESKGFIIENEGNNYMVSFSKENASIWDEYISNHLELGYWNEYLADNRVIFLFHLHEGVKRYVVDSYENDEVLKLCEKFCQCKFESIKSMLSSNHFYKDKIH